MFFKSKPRKKQAVTPGWTLCHNCGKYIKQSHYDAQMWVHFLGIPLFNKGSAHVIRECPLCRSGVFYPQAEFAVIIDNIRTSARKALDALAAGEKTFNDNGELVRCIDVLIDTVEPLLSIKADDELDAIMAELWQIDEYIHNYVFGRILQWQGKLDEAIKWYDDLSDGTVDTQDAEGELGNMYICKEEFQQARMVFERMLEYGENKMGLLSILIDIYAHTQNFTKLAEAYEKCLEVSPQLQFDNAFLNARDEARRALKMHQKMRGSNTTPW